jgi:hypothetical protein
MVAMLNSQFTAEAQRTQRFRREKREVKKKWREISLLLFYSLSYLSFSLRNLCVLWASAVNWALITKVSNEE